jgi:monoamine oxidase
MDGVPRSHRDRTRWQKRPTHRNNTWLRANRVQARRGEYSADPSSINEGFHPTGDEVRMTAARMVNDALEEVRDYYSDRRHPFSSRRY